MNNWLCIIDNTVVNIITADKIYLDNNSDIKQKYDSFLNRDTILMDPAPNIGSYLAPDGKNWIIPMRKSLVGQNFSKQNLTDKDFSYTDLTGCIFTGATIDGCSFHGTNTSTYSLVGAIWNGKIIQYGPIQMENPYYYFIVTDVFTQAGGCVSFPTYDLQNYSDKQLSALDPNVPTKPNEMWAFIKDAYLVLINGWAKGIN